MCGIKSHRVIQTLNTDLNFKQKHAESEDTARKDTDEYGFFEDLDVEDNHPIIDVLESCDSRSSIANTSNADDSCYLSSPDSDSSMNFSPDNIARKSISLRYSADKLDIICSLADEQAPVSCRSFPDGLVVQVSLAGFRMIRCYGSEIAEYKVVMKLDNLTLTAWKRFEDFEALAQYYFKVALHLNRTDPIYTDDPLKMKNTLRAWNAVKRNRSDQTFEGHAAQFLVSETSMLKIFVKHLLFEAPIIQGYISFME